MRYRDEPEARAFAALELMQAAVEDRAVSYRTRCSYLSVSS